MTNIESRLRAHQVPTLDLGTLAERAGLLDVAVAHMDSPVGTLLLAATPRGLVRLTFSGHDETLADLAARVSPRVVQAPKQLDPVRRQLDEYFAGARRSFDIKVDWALVGEWRRMILRACARIPYGEVRTYGQIAAAAGKPRAAQAAGGALGRNPVPIVVPCHRVLGTSGKLVGYTGGLHIKEHLLRLEGVLAP